MSNNTDPLDPDTDGDTLSDWDEVNSVDGVGTDPTLADTDGDGFGDAASNATQCLEPVGWVTDMTDCDDTDEDVNPDATETWYDGVDSDCDEASDYDADGDGYDSADHGGTDCDDTDSSTHPGATDADYDGVDSDCDGASDYDADGDGHDAAEFGGDDCDDGDDSDNNERKPTATGGGKLFGAVGGLASSIGGELGGLVAEEADEEVEEVDDIEAMVEAKVNALVAQRLGDLWDWTKDVKPLIDAALDTTLTLALIDN